MPSWNLQCRFSLRRRNPIGTPRALPGPAVFRPGWVALGVLVFCFVWAVPVHAAKPALAGLAVFPLTPQRGSEHEQRLSGFFQQEIVRSVLRWGRVPVLTAETAALWQRKFGLNRLQGPSGKQLKEMGVQAALHGSVQVVAGLAQIKVGLTGATGDMLLGGTVSQRINISAKPPREVLDDLLHDVFSALFQGDAPQATSQPAQWESLWRYQDLMDKQLPPGADQSHETLLALQTLAQDTAQATGQALAGRVALALARMLLQHAILESKDGGRRGARLNLALGHAIRATEEEPWNAEALALKGEVLYFLRREYESRTEASVARLKNPLSGLAHAVLGMSAGLSTGEASENLRRALALNPFLRSANRPEGAAPYQNGLLEPVFARWDRILAKRGEDKTRRAGSKLNRAIALFEQRKWREAEKLLAEAAESNEYSHEPELYLARIQIETGDPQGAAERLGKLVAEFPQEAEGYYYYGIALENSKAYTKAMDAFQRALAEKPGDERALLHLGTAAMGRGDWSRALDALRLLLTRNDQHAEGWLNYGIVHAKSEQWQDADDAFLRAMQLNPRLEQARRWREQISEKLKQKP